MPIRNVATLLENIVLVEAARIVLAETESEQVVEFVNPFAMPPLSAWQGHERDRGFDEAHLAALAGASDRARFSTFMTLLAATLRLDSSQGPSGALLVGLLARQAGRTIRMWLNDLPDDQGAHYPNAIAGLRDYLPTLDRMWPTSQSRVEVQVCDTAYPASLDHLAAAISSWRAEGSPAARLGYLDPMKYSIENRQPNQTSRDDHRRWLRLLEDGVDGLLVSVHFTGNSRSPNDLNHELHSMFQDGADRRFDVVEFRHANYAAVVHFKNHENLTRTFGDSLEVAVTKAWRSWFEAAEGVSTPSSLYVTHRRKLLG